MEKPETTDSRTRAMCFYKIGISYINLLYKEAKNLNPQPLA